MEVEGRRVLILGGSGLVGSAIARRLLELDPAALVVGGLREEDAVEAVEELSRLPAARGIELVPEWGDVFLRRAHGDRSRARLLEDPGARGELLDDLFGPLEEGLLERSHLFDLLDRHRPDILVDCINTATAIAYQDLFESAERLRARAVAEGAVGRAEMERHLGMLHLPQLIRHVQLLLEAMRRTGTRAYVKIGTSGTGGMGLNVPFTHSEERPSPNLLAKASVAGAHSALLFLMGRTPGAPAVVEVKPTAAIAWKRIRYGPVLRGGRPIPRVDAGEALAPAEAFPDEDDRRSPTDGERGREEGGRKAPWRETGEVLESVYLDAGENGLFSLSEFETISALGMMEVITPEEIAEAAVDEIRGRPTGRNVVAALDGATFGPTYRGGVLRQTALDTMERLETEHGVRSVAFEMLGPPRLSKLLFEGAILERLFDGVEEAAALDPDETAERAEALVREDARLRTDALSVGIPILLPDGRILRGPRVQVEPPPGADPGEPRWAHRGWVDLRRDSWVQWRERCRAFAEFQLRPPGAEAGSGRDLDGRAASGAIRAGALAAYVFRVEDEGERRKR